MPMRIRVHSALIALAFVPVLLMACGDGGVTNPAPVAVSVSPSTASLAAGESAQFTATVTGTSETGVTWTASAGAVSGSGNTVTYTAPATAGTHSLKATSIADPTRSASASITVDAANVLVNRVPVPASGGSVVVDQPDSPLHGLTIELPAGAYPATSHWTVAEEDALHPALPPGFTQIGTAFRIRNERQYADAPFTMTIPVPEASRENAVAFFYEPASGTFELIPLLGSDDTGIVVVTRHVSSDRILIPGGGPAGGTVGWFSIAMDETGPTFGEVSVVVVEVDPAILDETRETTFRPGTHDWEFVNHGSWLTPGGFCTGSTITALYNHYVNSGATLFGTYAPQDALWHESAQGIRLASVIQESFDLQNLGQQMDAIREIAYDSDLGVLELPRTQALALAAALKLTGLPQLVVVQIPYVSAHAIIAYGVSSRTFHVADPNYPGLSRSITYGEDAWDPFPLSTIAGAQEEVYDEVYVVGVTGMISLADLDAEWMRFEAETAGDDEFPEVKLEYFDPVDTLVTWLPIPNTIVTTSDSLLFRAECVSRCLPGYEHAALDSYNDRGDRFSWDWERSPVLVVAVDSITSWLDLVIYPYGEVSSGSGWTIIPVFADFTRVPVRQADFTLSATPANPEPGDSVAFGVEHGGLLTAGRQLRWDFGDGSALIEGSDARVKHVYDQPGSFQARVQLFRASDGAVLARDSVAITVGMSAWVGTVSLSSRNTHPGFGDNIRVEGTDIRFEPVPGDNAAVPGGSRLIAVSGKLTVWNEVSCVGWVSPVVEVELTRDDRQWLMVRNADPLAPEGTTPAPGVWFTANAYTGGMEVLTRACPSEYNPVPPPEPYVFATGVVWLNTHPLGSGRKWTQAADPNVIEGSYVGWSGDLRQEWSWRLERADLE